MYPMPMTTLIHADIFFFVATIAVAVVAVLLVIVLVYAIKLLGRFRAIARRIERGLAAVEDAMDRNGSLLKKFIRLVTIFRS